MKNLVMASLIFIGANSHADRVHEKRNEVYARQYRASIQYLFKNMLPNGAIVASPSKHDPDYYYDWVRGSSLVMKEVVFLAYDRRVSAEDRELAKKKIDLWVEWELGLQATPKSADLGEPRFHVDGKVYTGPWGRPQNDGPALRALTAIMIAQRWIAEGKLSEVKKYLYQAEVPAKTLIKRDLEYVAHHWRETSFDLWEEEKALHFYTLTVQRVALLKGAALAKKLGDSGAAKFYSDQTDEMKKVLAKFVKGDRVRYAIEKEKSLPHKKSELDMAVLLAAVQTFDGKFYVPVTPVLRTVNEMIDVFRKLYDINAIRSKNGTPIGIALGRYPDDQYNGTGNGHGSPWFITTLALGQFACQLKTVQPSSTHEKLDKIAMDEFNRALLHRDSEGRMSEQFNRISGKPQGASDLSWSYAAFISAFRECAHSDSF